MDIYIFNTKEVRISVGSRMHAYLARV